MPSTDSLPALTSAMEDYLEVIFHLEREHRIARVRDIAQKLGVKMSSVSSALKSLASRGFIQYDPHQYITLTERGIKKATQIVRKHEILKRFLTSVLRVDETTAEDNACRIEHHLDPEVIEKLVRFVEFVEMCPVEQSRWLESIAESCEDCMDCLAQAGKKVQDRVQAQKTALEAGMTLAGTSPGAQVMVQDVRVADKGRKALTEQGLAGGAILQVEKTDPTSGGMTVNIKGYHVTLSPEDASNILVKPV